MCIAYAGVCRACMHACTHACTHARTHACTRAEYVRATNKCARHAPHAYPRQSGPIMI